MSPETTVYLYCPHAKMTITTTSVSSVTSSLPNKSGYFRLSEANQKITEFICSELGAICGSVFYHTAIAVWSRDR